VAGEEPVVAPDQLKPGHRKSGRIGAVVVAISLVLMMFCNNDITGLEKLWLIGFAVALVGWVIVDSILRRNGLRS
jgi:multisubunit Na+/H+ antiporter MnhB subunit